MLRDDEIFPMAARGIMADVYGEDPRINANDDFDDVFGSVPSSPSFPPSDLETSRDADTNISLDDSSYVYSAGVIRGGNLEVSDIPRLKEKHQTEGYRDGVTAGKATSVQAGFDEGYGLGAVLGLKIGAVIGILEGLGSAVRVAAKADGSQDSGDCKTWVDEKDRLQKLLVEAMNELKTENVFSRDLWGDDGIWKFEVPGEDKDGEEVVFPDVASAHPLVKKWEGIVAQEVRRWGLDLGVMEKREAIEGSDKRIGSNKELPLETSVMGEGILMGTPQKALNW